MFRTVPLSIIRSFSLYKQNDMRHTVMLTACELDQFRPEPARKLSAYHCCVYSEKLLMIDRGTLRNM